MTTPAMPTEEEIGAFIDGEIDPARMAEIAQLIEIDAVLASRVGAYRSDKLLIATTYGPFIDRPLPAAWVDRIQTRKSTSGSSGAFGGEAFGGGPFGRGTLGRGTFRGRALANRPAARIAAMAAAILLFVAGALVIRYSPTDEPIVAEALAARADSMPSRTVLTGEMLGTGAARNAALASTLGLDVKAPDLSRMGYQLTTMRVYDGVAGGKAVELSYQQPAGHRFTLYLRHPSSPPRVDLLNRHGLRICIWQDEVVGAVMTGEMSAGEMARLASLAYAGLTL
jgi:anti-sigma factor RsiW